MDKGNIEYANKLIDEQILADSQTEEDEQEVDTDNAIVEAKPNCVVNTDNVSNPIMDYGLDGTLHTAHENILNKASEKINEKSKVDQKAKRLAKLVDDKFEVEAEAKDVEIAKQNAKNKADKKELKNRMIVLNNEAKRIEKEQKHLNNVQKIEHAKARKEALWQTYGKSLSELGYTYVPNKVTLTILMWLVGAKAFFNGLDKVATSIIKSAKWIILVGLIIGLMMCFPTTANIVKTILGFN